MSDFVINHGKPDQFRASMEIVESFDGSDHQYIATVTRVGTGEKLAQASGLSASAAFRGAQDQLREKFETVEAYERMKHRDLSLRKVLKK